MKPATALRLKPVPEELVAYANGLTRELETLISPGLYESAFARGMAEAIILQLNAKFGELDAGLLSWMRLLSQSRVTDLALAVSGFQSEMYFIAWVHDTKEYGYIVVSRPRRKATAKVKK